MAEFNPANARFRYALEAVKTVPNASGATYHDALLRTEGLTNTYDQRIDPSIYAGAQRAESLPGKAHAGGPMAFTVKPEELTRIFALAQGKVTTTTPGGATLARLNKMFPSGSTDVLDTMTIMMSRDDDSPQRFLGAQPSEIVFAMGAEGDAGVLSADMTFLAAIGDYWPFATVVAGAGATDPHLRGIPPYDQWTEATATDSKVHVKISDVTDIADGIIEVLVKIGDAASYGAIASVVNIGINPLTSLPYWNNLYDSTSGELIGGFGDPLQVHFVNSTSLAVDDAWSWTRERTVWTPSYPDTKAFNEINAAVYIDGVEYCINEFSLTLGRPVIERFCIGGRRAAEVRNRGVRTVDLEFTREYLDISLRKRLETAKEFSFRVDCYTPTYIEGTTRYRFSLIAAKCIPSGPTASVESQDEMNETITATCHPSSDVNYPDDLVIEELNTLTSVAT